MLLFIRHLDSRRAEEVFVSLIVVLHVRVAQLVEQRTENPWVSGSSPLSDKCVHKQRLF
jgi:hypothetical protein